MRVIVLASLVVVILGVIAFFAARAGRGSLPEPLTVNGVEAFYADGEPCREFDPYSGCSGPVPPPPGAPRLSVQGGETLTVRADEHAETMRASLARTVRGPLRRLRAVGPRGFLVPASGIGDGRYVHVLVRYRSGLRSPLPDDERLRDAPERLVLGEYVVRLRRPAR